MGIIRNTIKNRALVSLAFLLLVFITSPALAEESSASSVSAASLSGTVEIVAEGGAVISVPVPDTYEFSGAAMHVIPIEVVPGRNGIQPNLNLTYNSYQKNGWLGVGWDLDLGAIQRSTIRGVDYKGDDYIVLKEGSALELVARSEWGQDFYGAKIEAAFTKYFFNAASGGWEATTRDGTRYFYGSHESSRQQNSSGVFRWCLDKVVDTNANNMIIAYTKNQGRLYPSQIIYTGNQNSGFSGTKSVNFIVEDRNDVSISYKSLAKVTTAKRLDKITIYAKTKEGVNQLVRIYDLNYAYGASTGRSRLNEIKLYGSDGVSTLPAASIAYQEGKPGRFDSKLSWTLKNISPAVKAYLADVNGDARTDVIFKSGSRLYYQISNGDGTFYTISDKDSFPGDTVGFADINGDGRSDYIGYDKYSHKYFVRLSKKPGKYGSLIVSEAPGTIYDGAKRFFADINADGYTDIVYRYGNKCYNKISNGDGTFDEIKKGSSFSGDIVGFADVNGDGLSDYIGHSKAYNYNIRSLYVHLSKGNGKYADAIRSDISKHVSGSDAATPYMGDLNGDGLADVVFPNVSSYVLFSKGDGTFKAGGGWDQRAKVSVLAVTDVNGDGTDDLLGYRIYSDTDYETTTGYLYVMLNRSTGTVDLMTSYTDFLGSNVSIRYAPSTQYANDLLPFVVNTVSSIKVDDGLGNLADTRFDYSGGRFDPLTRSFNGFSYVKKINPDNSILESWYHQDQYRKGKPYLVKLSEPDQGSLLSRTTLSWHEDVLNPAQNDCEFVKLARKETEFYDDKVITTFEAYTYDSDIETNPLKIAGNLRIKEVSVTDTKTIKTVFEYDNFGDWVWRKTKEALKNELDEPVRETLFGFEDTTGNLLSKEFVLDTEKNPLIRYEYDEYGNVIYEYDANGNPPTVTTYDSATKTFPETVTNPLGHAVEYYYDFRYGKVIETIDANVNSTYFDYDEFGRPQQIDHPDGGRMITEYYDEDFPRYVITKVKEDASGSTIDKYRYIDGLGREIQTVTFGEAGKSIVTKKFYDAMGRNDLAEGPFFSTDVGYPLDPPTAYPWQQTTFDYRGRPLAIESADGEYGSAVTTFTYSGLTTTVTDPDGSQKAQIKDHPGRIVEIIEQADQSNLKTTYAYNAAGDLLQVKDHYGNTTTISYDTLSRKLSMNDPDMGFWEYTYDANGNLITQTDEKLQTVNFKYDALNRVTSKTYSTSDPAVAYAYDNRTIPNGIGQRFSVSNTRVTTTYDAYDEMGNVTGLSKAIIGDPNVYATRYAYDLSGKVTETIYPDGYQVTHKFYPGTGLLEAVTGSDAVEYARSTNYEPTGKIGRIEHSNGTFTIHTYDPESTRLISIVTSNPGPTTDLQNKAYKYTAAGDIKEITDNIKSITFTYSYDKLHRLTAETNTGSYDPISYTYNAIGNIMSKTVGTTSMTYTYDTLHKHAVRTINFNGIDHTYAYDDNGNMLAGPDFTDPTQMATRTITYNADNMPSTVSHSKGSNEVTTRFVYGGDGVRAKKTIEGASSTCYIGDHYEVKNRVATKYIFAGNLRVAMIKGSDVNYYHKDHLGSSTVMTDASGTMLETTDYMPFGFQRDSSGPNPNVTHYRFTDQELDVESGLYNYNARLYDAVTGRFISADTIIQKAYDPQVLNRYAYVRNNPLIYTDPSGHHYGTDSPGGKADFGGETVSGERNDPVSGPRGDVGWEEFYNPSTSIQINTRTSIVGKAIVQKFTYVVKRDENILASTKEIKIAGYTETASTPFDRLNRKYKEQAVELTPENARHVGKVCACATMGMLSLGIVAKGYGLIAAYGLWGSLPEAAVIGYGATDAAMPGPPATGPGQLMRIGKDTLGWCFEE
jgi:RHS repeat-associated protein